MEGSLKLNPSRRIRWSQHSRDELAGDNAVLTDLFATGYKIISYMSLELMSILHLDGMTLPGGQSPTNWAVVVENCGRCRTKVKTSDGSTLFQCKLLLDFESNTPIIGKDMMVWCSLHVLDTHKSIPNGDC
uniref:Uncharacterized protein n=1 Tax=Physcomitrium patens TaxID=3218 RepID=A0A2K1IB79_PHYPA|nr:hypothetical protein PHYPA_031100 [Physcomitrium patens]